MRKSLSALSLCVAAAFGSSAQTRLPAPARSSALPTVQPSPGRQNSTGILDLPNGSKFQTTLYNLKVIGQLPTVHKLPYYVLSGVGCEECDANISIYIHSPSDGPMKNEGLQQRFEYPGRQLSPEDRTVVSRTRVFLGNCAAGHPDAVIWFERWIGDDKHWHQGVVLAEIKDDTLVTTTPKTGTPTLTGVQGAVQRSSCREISGLDQWQEP